MRFSIAGFALSLSSLAFASGHESRSDVKGTDWNNMIIEEVLPSYEDMVVNNQGNNEHSSRLRKSRQLQTTTTTPVVCRATNMNQRGVNLCGDISSSNFGDCTEASTCTTQPGYECLCTGSDTPTTCGYCQVRTANTIDCQVTGSSTNFLPPDADGVRQTCTCEILPGNIVNQTCFTPNPTPPPAMMPAALLFPTPAPQAVMPTSSSSAQPVMVMPPVTPAPQAAMPVPAQPVAMPVATPAPQPVPTLAPQVVVTPAPQMAVPTSTPVPMCRATSSGPVALCATVAGTDLQECTDASTCDSMEDYECLCTGAFTPTTCGYCQVYMARDMTCLTSGSTTTVTEASGLERRCQCEILPSGETNLSCVAVTPDGGVVPTSPSSSPPPAMPPSVSTTSPNTCRVTDANQQQIILCGTVNGVEYGECTDDTTCASLPGYDCLCVEGDTSFTPTTCGYCEMRTPFAVMCQISGGVAGYQDSLGNSLECTCEILPNGEVDQTCFSPNADTPAPQEAPTTAAATITTEPPVVPPTLAPEVMPTPTISSSTTPEPQEATPAATEAPQSVMPSTITDPMEAETAIPTFTSSENETAVPSTMDQPGIQDILPTPTTSSDPTPTSNSSDPSAVQGQEAQGSGSVALTLKYGLFASMSLLFAFFL